MASDLAKLETYTASIYKIMEQSARDFAEFKKEMQVFNKEKEKDMKELRNLNKDIQKSIGGYTKNEADAIEDEINKKLPNILQRKFPGNNIFQIKSWKTLITNKKEEFIANARDTKEITEFDGLYIVSNDRDFDVNDGDDVIYKSNSTKTVSNSVKHFVVMEAKHAQNVKKVDTKINQMIKFQSYIRDSKDLATNKSAYTKGFIMKAQCYQLDFIDKPMYLIFASPLMPDDVIIHINNISPELEKQHNIIIAYMTRNANNYSISWANTGFQQQTNLNTSGITFRKGGKKSTASK